MNDIADGSSGSRLSVNIETNNTRRSQHEWLTAMDEPLKLME